MRIVIGPLLFVLIALVACNSAGPSGNIALEGTEWRAVSVAGQAPVPRQEPTIAFGAGVVKGSGGCNSYGGNARIDAGRLIVDQVASTLRACLDDRANRMEQTFLAVLGSKPAIGIRDGRLVLQSDAGEIVFEQTATAPAVSG
jgi:heat shock protein HslJ